MHIQKLVDEVLALAQSEENERRTNKRQALLKHDPAYVPPVMVRLNREYVASRIALNLKDIIHDTEAYLRLELMSKILRFTEFDEDTPLVPDVVLQLGVAFDPSMCGLSWVEVDGEEPWIGEPILASADEVERLEIPEDFHGVGMMPLAIRLYEETKTVLRDKIKVYFQDWLAGPSRIVQNLRGVNDLFLDLYDNPEGVHKMFAYSTDVRRRFEAFRQELVGTGSGPGEAWYWEFKILANDEVNAELLSPKHYREFVYPYDLEYCRDYRHVYFHGSGKFTPYLPIIRTLPNVELIEISNWTDIAEASEVLGDKVILERTFLQTEEAFTAAGDTKSHLLEELVEGAKRSCFYFLLNVDNPEERLEERIREWIQFSREAISRYFPRR